jgi:CRISPR-associated endonuclease/helicase Cas3
MIPPGSFWGKLARDPDGRVAAWLSVADHCADVAACCEALLQRTLLRRRLARLAGRDDLDDRQIARLSVLCALHDLGKFSVGFQNKALGKNAPFVCGHLREALALLFCGQAHRYSERVWSILAGDQLASWGDESGMAELIVATIGHHGRPVTAPPQLEDRWWAPARGLDPLAGLAELVAFTRRWFPAAWAAGGEPLPTNPELQHGWCGLVTLADWLGSDAERFFPLGGDDGADRMEAARPRARRALKLLGLDAATAREALGGAAPGYERVRANLVPRPAQARMLDVPLPASGGVVVLEAETGSGKTEAALAHYLRLFHAGRVDGLYFALPTRAAARQIYDRIRDAVETSAFPGLEDPPPVVLAVPGYIVVDGVAATRLAPFEVQWPDDPDQVRRHRGWAGEHPKRFLAGAVVVGTIDQVLLSGLMVPHAHMRATALIRQLLVVDEVHASDLYMTRVLESVLDRHTKAGGHALLMSATLGAAARSRLLAAGRRRSLDGTPALEEAIGVPYPLISSSAAVDREPSLLAVEESTSGKAVELRLRPWIEDAETIARHALEPAERGARVLVIRNTVAGCQEVQAALEAEPAEREPALLFRCEGAPAPHHSRFARADRDRLDRSIEVDFGVGRGSGGRVAIATQTVEQSLDIDADLLITDLCPVDVLLQRIGRLHRHRRDRPAGFERAMAIVLEPEYPLGSKIQKGGEAVATHGLGRVYEDLRALEACRRLIQENPEISIPADNRRLVETGTHPAALHDLASAAGEEWLRHEEHVLGTLLGRGRIASLHLLRTDRTFDPSDGQIEFPSDCKIPTRLGEDDRLVRFAEPPAGPFGAAVTEITIPAFLVEKAPPPAEETEARDVTAEAGGFTFRFGQWSFRYDRLGLRSAS